MLYTIAQTATATTDPWTIIAAALAAALLGGGGLKGAQIVISRKKNNQTSNHPTDPQPFVTEARFQDTTYRILQKVEAITKEVAHMKGVLEGLKSTTDRIASHLMKPR